MTRFMNNDESLGVVHLYTSLNDRVLRVREQKNNKKDHECEHCKSIILSGSSSFYVTGLSAGRFYDYHACTQCYE